MSSTNNRELLKALKKGSEQDFKLLFEQCFPPVYRTVRRIVIIHEDAEDICQQVFLKIWKKRKQFRGDSKVTTWMYRIAVNEALSFIRSGKSRSFTDPESLENHLYSDPYFDESEALVKLQSAVKELPGKQKLIFQLRYFEALRIKEVCEILDLSEGAVKASYHLAVEKIKKLLVPA